MAAHDDDQHEGSIPLLEMEPSSREPITSKRRARPSSPVRFLLATALLVLGGLGAFYVWTQGRPAYTKYSKHWNPHSKQLYFRNGTSASESELVRPLFVGHRKDLGFDRFDLIASVYYRQHSPYQYGGGRAWDSDTNSTATNDTTPPDATPTSTGLAARASGMTITTIDSTGRVIYSDDNGDEWTPPPEPEWQRIYSRIVMLGVLPGQTGNAVVPVVLPGSILPALRDERGGWAELKAAFHLIPSSESGTYFVPNSVLHTTNSTHYLGERNKPGQEDYFGFGGPREDFPLPYPAVGRNVSEQNDTVQPWESRIPGSPAINLLRRIVPPWQTREERFVDDAKDDEEDEEDDPERDRKAKEEEMSPWRDDIESGRPRERMVLVKRSMVTLIDQSPVYSLPKFEKKMRALKRREEGCRHGRRRWETCTRTFTNRGHFETLLQMADGKQPDAVDTAPSTERVVGYRYPPFLHSNYGKMGPRDYTNLTEVTEAQDGDEPDFTFDWHISFSPVSAAKAAFAEAYHESNRDRDFSQYGDDRLIFDHPDDVTAPWQDQAELLSAIMGHSFSPNSHPILRLVLLNLASLASLISIVLTAYFWYSRILTTGISIPAHAIDTLVRFIAFGAGVVQRGDRKDWMMTPVVVLISGLVWSLCARLEWVGGGPKEMVLVSVRRRRATKGERASAREDGKFTWQMWAGLVSLALVFTNFALPVLPPIIPPSLVAPTLTKISVFLTPTVQASAIQLLASQLHLNHRLRTFGGSYRLVAYLDLASAVLAVLPIVMNGWLGRWETMPAFGLVEVGWVIGRAALAGQACLYPRVEQREVDEQ